jgi:ribosomal-protein-alanine N-acetyltransferase
MNCDQVSVLPRQIDTPRLRLREPAVSDAGEIFRAYTQDVEVSRFMIWKPHASEAVTREFLAWCVAAWQAGGPLPFVITRSGSDIPIGMIEARPQGATVDIGYVLAREHWGQGLMPEAIRALADAALADPGIFRVQAACDVENIPSQRALEKSGLVREARLERFTVHPNVSPEPRPCFMYARCR